MRGRLAILALVVALPLAGCAAKKETVPPPTAEPGQAPEEPTPTPTPTPPPATTTPAPPSPTLGSVTAPWDTAALARAREARRNHVYPRGESALGRKLVDALPDPGGLTPSEGGPPPTPLPPWTPTPGDSTAGRECWQAQLLATSDRARAERVKSEAEALLGVPAVVFAKDGAYRVRAGGCLDADAALRLVERARGERWPEAFRVREGA